MIYCEPRHVVGISKDRRSILVYRLGCSEPSAVLNDQDFDQFMTGMPDWASVQEDILNVAQLLGWARDA